LIASTVACSVGLGHRKQEFENIQVAEIVAKKNIGLLVNLWINQ
jgi:hypothetical protein